MIYIYNDIYIYIMIYIYNDIYIYIYNNDIYIYIYIIYSCIYAVNPLYRGHNRDLKIVSIIERCPLHRGSS